LYYGNLPTQCDSVSFSFLYIFILVCDKNAYSCLTFLFWPLCCLSSDLRFLINLLTSSNSSWTHITFLLKCRPRDKTMYSHVSTIVLLYYEKGALDSQPQVITFTSCLPMVGGSLRVLRLIPSLKLVAMI
jgi:hypothetical protein